MQNLKPGDLVRVRRARWRIVDVRPYDACQLITLTAVDNAHGPLERRVIAPFDIIDPILAVRRARVVGARRWRRACRSLLAANAPPGGLRTARHGQMDLLPHQLEPALAILRGVGSRALLADDVGLGKTLQAGLAIAELRARGLADRVLILTPAGVRDQWAAELSQRLGIDAAVVDASAARRLVATLPVGVNPWTAVPLAIASVDYIKRPEVLPSVASCRWDVLVVDEAHNVAGDSDRFRAVDALASRASYVLLLTATPHSGDRRTFTSLCRIGARDDADPLMIFRRTRQDVRLGTARRVHRLHVRSSLPEHRMHAVLARFTKAVRAEHGDGALLALGVLHKRALSSARSLERSVERRLMSIETTTDSSAAQLFLPLDDSNGELNAADDVPVWGAELSLSDAGRERRMLTALRHAAREASADETKLRALRRLLRRAGEPAVVFTEYRDTLLHLRDALAIPTALLHGGLTRQERAIALADFTTGRCAVLLATDAAGEGLNLHQQCRLVINLELPWNPMRLEQRIGRVDRIGQRRTVHAVHLIAHEAGESRILDRLKTRMARARADIDVPDPVGADEERAVAASIVGGRVDSVQPRVEGGASPPRGCVFPSLADDAAAEVRRLTFARSLRVGDHSPSDDALLVMRARHRVTRARLNGRALLIFRAIVEDGHGRIVESTLIPAAIASPPLPWRALRDARTLGAIEDTPSTQLAAALITWREHAMNVAREFASERLRRERAIAGAADDGPAGATQPGLFDRRVENAAAAMAARQQECDEEQHARLRAIERASILHARPARILLAIVP
jgi:superfamily II DNA or RNA helicase